MLIDATKDKHNVYWTIIKRDVTAYLDLAKLKDPAYQLRVEARIRLHTAPHRVNFMVNTQRTTNFHVDLMEYDIPDTTNWYTISMTTKKFDAHPGDTVYVQLCATDFGIGKYCVDVDYYRADIVNVNNAGPDLGELTPYHPPIPEISTFSGHLDVSQDALVNTDFPEVNFNNWSVEDANAVSRVLTVKEDQWAVLRWDFEKYRNMIANGAGLLELTTHSVFQGGNYIAAYGEEFGMEFGKIRVIEILEGDTAWDENSVSFKSLLAGKDPSEVFNSQMIYDVEVNKKGGDKNYITISRPVLQRLIDGTTKGLLIRPLGSLAASFYDADDKNGEGPRLHFNVVQPPL